MNGYQDYNQVVSLLKAGETETARQLVLRILKKDVNQEWGWYLLSHCVDEPHERLYALRQALRINPDNHRVRSRMNEIKADSPNRIETLTRLETEGIKSDAALESIEELLLKGKIEAARNRLIELLKIHPDTPQAWFRLSQVSNKSIEERIYLRQTLRCDPDHEDARSRLEQLEGSDRESFGDEIIDIKPVNERLDAFISFGKFSVRRITTLFITVVVGLYITILIANMGGYVDQIFEGMIAEQMMAYGFGKAAREIPEEEREARLAEIQWQLEESMGLHTPFFTRTIRWLVYGLTLNFGESYLYYFFGGVMRGADQTVRGMIFQHLPYTLTLIGASNILLFITSVSTALVLSRKYGSWMDRISAALASLSSAPSWIFGIILILVLAGKLMILPFPKVIDLQFADFSPRYIRLLLSQMIMPVLAIFFSIFFQGVYAWRTFFLIYSQEDYVEMARAMGLPARKIERQYILKPTFPYVITNFAMLMITVWESSIALEVLFYWPGIGPLFLNAANAYRTSIIVGIVVIFAYLLAITVFTLDLIYAVIDPRVRLGVGDQKLKAARKKGRMAKRIKDGFWAIRDGVRMLGSWITSIPEYLKIPFSYRIQAMKRIGRSLRMTLSEIRSYPSAIIGLIIIVLLVLVSIFTVIKIPQEEVVRIWSVHTTTGNNQYWGKYPRNAAPAWTNTFRRVKLPETIQMNTADGQVEKSYQDIGENMTEVEFSYEFDYTYDDFPDEISLFFESQFKEKLPHITLTWSTPDEREIQLDSFSLESSTVYRLTQNEKLNRKLGGNSPNVGLFVDPSKTELVPIKGTYRLTVSGIVFEENSDIDCEFVLYGRVYGLAGTDNHRRDLMIALLWGTPVALAFGLFGAVGTSLIAMVISAIGVWYGGWVDELIQRITEVNIMLPTLPIAIMIFVLYSRSIWTVLLVIVLLNIFGSAIKNYRAAFIQVRESAYIEGAIAYGAKGGRIIIHYLIPRILPVLLPQLVIMVPGFVYYEATLAYLGLSDPYLPTWGKVVHDAILNGAYLGYYYWILEPIILLLVTGLAFALLGFALDRVVNPRLREI